MSDIFNQYHILADFLGHILSSNYEIALLDLRDDMKCITKLINGHVTERIAGAPITDFALQIIKSGEYKTKDYLVNYSGMSSGNKTLKSSTLFIKDGETLLGMLCINIDMTNYIKLCDDIMSLSGTGLPPIQLICNTSDTDPIYTPTENFSNDLTTTIEKIIGEQIKTLSTSPDRLKKHERISFITELNKTGLFLMKGSVSAVAAHLKRSEATIYRYLSMINNNENM